jgi:hypothetical protein
VYICIENPRGFLLLNEVKECLYFQAQTMAITTLKMEFKEFSLGLAEGLQGIISRLDDRFAQS